MHAVDVLFYGNRTVEMTVANIPFSEWQTPDVCGIWSVKDIIAHLASHELVLVEVLSSFLSDDATPTLYRYRNSVAGFNDPEVDKRRHLTNEQVLAEYRETHERSMELIRLLPPEKLQETGALPWYGKEYDLEDFIAYGFYGHKREHCSQINVFRDELMKRGVIKP
jgi:DinB superfamily